MKDIFQQFYKDKKVLITGHTGFKGSWLTIWLTELGAKVIGVSLDPFSDRDNYVLSNLNEKMYADLRCDICDSEKLNKIFRKYKPDIVFHLAAQPLVRLSYKMPIETYQTNVMGTINVMEAIRLTESVKIGVMITTDKCYENKEQIQGYKENDSMGGYDPYSSSKGATEIAISSWRYSYFNPKEYKNHCKSLSSARAGNVVGGGDWAIDRIIPDCIKSIESDTIINIRNPKAIRPWQHVLEPLSGYLILAKKMWENPTTYCEGWNFGPETNSITNVWDIAEKIILKYGYGQLNDSSSQNEFHEANLLLLDITKAKTLLHWSPKLNLEQTITLTVDWYLRYKNEDVYKLCVEQINYYSSL